MKLRSNVCNRCRLMCVKFYLNRISFAAVIAKCLGGSLFWTHCSVATDLRCGGMFNDVCIFTFTATYAGERMLKIGQSLMQLRQKLDCLLFWVTV